MKKLLIICLIFLLVLPGLPGFAQSNLITVERISGQTRYDTSIRTSQAGFSQSNYAVIASGQNFPDAMAGGQLAGYLRAPLLITSPTGISSGLQAELQRLGVDTVYLLGGQNVLSNAIFSSLAGNGYPVGRDWKPRLRLPMKSRASADRPAQPIILPAIIFPMHWPRPLWSSPIMA